MPFVRNLLFVQAAITAWSGLGSDGGPWAFVTMVVAAGAVFVGAASVPTAGMRRGALGFEVAAVGFGLLSGHSTPATLLAAGMLAWLASPAAGRAFSSAPGSLAELLPGQDAVDLPPSAVASVVVALPDVLPAQDVVVLPPSVRPVVPVPAQGSRPASTPAAMTILPAKR